MSSRARRTGARGWRGSPLPTFTHNLTQVEVPGEVTVSRSAVYRQTNYVDPHTGETVPGCYNEVLFAGGLRGREDLPCDAEHRRHVR